MDEFARRTFLRVIETGSITAAARDLDTDVSTVSRRIAALEARLGVQLLERGPKRSEPTAAGLRFYEGMRRLIDEQDALEAEVRGEAAVPRGLLRVACPTNLGELHLTGWTIAFQEQHPVLEVELLLDDRYVDLRAANVDVAIRIGALSDSSLTARRIGAMELGLYAAPRYLGQHAPIRQPSDLSGHDFVLFSFLQAGDQIALACDDGRTERIAMRSRLSINNVGAISHAVAYGAGVHAGPLWLFEPLRGQGVVERVLPDWQAPLYPVHAVHNYGRKPPAKVRFFIDNLAANLARLPGIVR